MATRRVFIERIRRLIYGDQPSNDANITINLVSLYLNDAVAVAAKANYVDSKKLEGISFVNNSFYTTFKNISVAQDEQFLWKIILPQIPVGIGQNEGISTLKFKDSDTNEISFPVVWLTTNQLAYQRGMRPIPNKLLAYSESKYVYVISSLLLSSYTATVTMISGGDSTDLDSVFNVPDDYIPHIVEYIKNQLMFQRSVPVDTANDGSDVIKTV